MDEIATPREKTQWLDALVAKGIIKKNEPEKSKDDTIPSFVSDEPKKDVTELQSEDEDDLDEEEERAFQAYRLKRLAEMRADAAKAKFGAVLEISRQDYVDEVNKAGKDVWVVVHIYQPGDTVCTLINQHLAHLARKFPKIKFVKGVSSLCLEKFPESHLPAVFVYLEGQLKKQILGKDAFCGLKVTADVLEWMLHKIGAVQSDLEEDPRESCKPTKATKIFTSGYD